ncbi:MAG: hypothetical protein JWP14_3362 [Frankiales bacterium]|nr:hypothetical protein [Frankiales bacterium]
MTQVLTAHLPEQPGPGRLGRHLEHDPSSRDYPADMTSPIKSVRWSRRAPVLDQGDLGSCTGNAAAGWLATDTTARPGRTNITEQLAVDIYARASHLDRVKGIYPPDDTGSSGLAVAKAMVALGLTRGPYRHAFGLEHALAAMQTGPVLVGMAWLDGCDRPDRNGLISYTGTVRGGHEVLADEINTSERLVWFTNSWGTSWGQHGRFAMTWADLDRALSDGGDVTVPT